MSLADTLVARALECDGLSFGDLAKRPLYLLHQYNGDVTAEGSPTAAATDMGRGQYGCILHGRGLLAEDEVDGTIVYHGKSMDILRCAYAPLIGQIEGMMQAFAKARRLLVDSGDDLSDIQPADLVVIGMGGQAPSDPAAKAKWLADWGGVAHGVFVTGVSGDKIESVDGGQSDEKNPPHGSAIKRCERRLVKHANGWWLHDNHGARRINWRLRCADLPLRN